MTVLTTLQPYSDDQGNVVEYGGPEVGKVWIRFGGTNNRVTVAAGANLRLLKVFLDSNNGVVEIGPSRTTSLSVTARAGQDSAVRLGADVSSTGNVFLSATEGTEVVIGDDVMFATNNEVRADDAHAIYDVVSGARVNVSRSIHVGDHVWLGRDAVLLAGAAVGRGSVIGYRSVVTTTISNNCIAVGMPARTVRRDIAWERPHLASAPYYRPNAKDMSRSTYWDLTEGALEDPVRTGTRPGPTPVVVQSRRRGRELLLRVRRRAGAALRRAGLRH